MWQSPTPVLSFFGHQLHGRDAWVHVFATTWEELEIDKEDLCLVGFEIFGVAVAEKHANEDPAAVARRVYPETGEYFDDLYPGLAPPEFTFVKPDDAPF